ncbi:uncharacterized protein LOC141855885 [Brevipalpus obovatus]|uniref:uncharacterized protein LOC141855885 n=1 Tax=Brevipalpus obovatus TaxID=246614 RepID=UPI003D9F89F4
MRFLSSIGTMKFIHAQQTISLWLTFMFSTHLQLTNASVNPSASTTLAFFSSSSSSSSSSSYPTINRTTNTNTNITVSSPSVSSSTTSATPSRRDSMLASFHFNRALREARCKDPLPRVVHISDVYMSSRKKYLPHCTVLFRCSQDTGCCHSEDMVCGPKTIQTVKLNFWTVELTRGGQRKGVEILTFDNHTECECKSIIDEFTSKEPTSSIDVSNDMDNRIIDGQPGSSIESSSRDKRFRPDGFSFSKTTKKHPILFRPNRLSSKISDLILKSHSLFSYSSHKNHDFIHL